MAASLREALTSAVEQEETAAASAPEVQTAPTEAAPAAETSSAAPVGDLAAASSVETSSEPAPAETGTGGEPAAPASPAEAKPAAETKPLTAEEKENARLHRIDRPPTSWKKEAKGEWAALPLQARQEIHKREAEINRVLQQSAPDRQLAEQFKQVASPHVERMRQRGIDPVQATAGLFQADFVLSTAPQKDRAALMAKLIMDYGVSVQELDNALAPLVNGNPQAPAQQPDIAAIVQQQLSQALAPIMQREQQQRQQAYQEVEQTVESMSVDPKYPFFEDVRLDMADLIDLAAKRGLALSLDEAYSRAVRANPNTYGQLERQSTVSNATQAHQAAIRAKNAGSSISGAPAGGGGQRNTGDGSLRGAIEAAFGGQRL